MNVVNCKKHGETPAYKSKNKLRCKSCNSEAVVKRRKLVKLKAIEYKGGKCSNCGYNKCPDAFEFHHIDSNSKDFAISQYGHSRSWQRVKNELDKCVIVCANCHREIHAKINSGVAQR